MSSAQRSIACTLALACLAAFASIRAEAGLARQPAGTAATRADGARRSSCASRRDHGRAVSRRRCSAAGRDRAAAHRDRAAAHKTKRRTRKAPKTTTTTARPSDPGTAAPAAGSSTATSTTSATATSLAPFRFFSETSVWNTPLAGDAPLDPSSSSIVAALDAEVAAEQAAHEGPAINTTAWSVPLYTVPAGQPTVRVTLTNASAPLLQSAWEAVPMPADAHPAAGSDAVLVLWQPSTNRLWEFWHLQHTAEGWQAAWGGAMEHVSSDPGLYSPEVWPGAKSTWGSSSSSLSILGGLITLEDLELGAINHALAMAVPNTRAGVYASPAQRTDGASTSPASLPTGARLRLDPRLNLASLHLPKLTLLLAEAAQRYGIIVRDTAANVALYAQDPTPTGTEPYAGASGYFEAAYPNHVLAAFPWSHLQLLQMELHTTA